MLFKKIKIYNDRVKEKLLDFGFSLLIIILSIVFLFPFLSLISILFEGSTNSFNGLVLHDAKLYFVPSLIILFFVAIFAATLAILAAWFVSFYDFPFVKFFRVALVMPLAIPTYINAVVYSVTFEETIHHFAPQILFDIRNIYGVILITSLSLYPYIYILLYNHFKKFSALVSVARLDGKRGREIFFKIILPSSKQPLTLGMLLVAMDSLSEFGILKYFDVKTLTTGIYDNWFFWGNYQNAGIIALMLIIITCSLTAIYRFLRHSKKFNIQIESNNSLADRVVIKKTSLSAFFVCSFLVLISFVFPLSQLLWWLVESKFSYIDRYFVRALTNSVVIAFVAAAVIMILSIILVYFKYTQSEHKMVQLFIRYFSSSYLPPGPVIAIGVLTISVILNKFFADSFHYLFLSYVVLIYAYTARFLTLGFADVNRSYEEIPEEIHNISNCSIKDNKTRIKEVLMPLMNNNLIVCYILIFIEIVKELPLTLFIKFPEFISLATYTYELSYSGDFKQSSATAIAIILINVLAIHFLSKNFSHKDGVKWEN